MRHKRAPLIEGRASAARTMRAAITFFENKEITVEIVLWLNHVHYKQTNFLGEDTLSVH
jgi:hypothetical protein